MKKCLVCDGQIKIFCKRGGFLIYRCSKCGFGFTEGSETKAGEYHRDESYIGERKQFVNIFKRRIKLINKHAKNPGKVLEIGSSTGALLSILKSEGWRVCGVEISPKAVRFAESDGIYTIQSTFEKANFQKNSFDAVVLNHTLEHLNSPKDVLKKVHSLLKKGGLILIDVPNFGSLSAGVLKCRWPYLLPEEHRWHFTFKALEQLLYGCSFTVLEKSMPSGIWDYGNPWLEVWQAFVGGKKRFFRDFITVIPSFSVTLFRVGTSLTVLARKR